MRQFTGLLWLISCGLVATPECLAQATHTDDVQVIRPPDVKPDADHIVGGDGLGFEMVVEQTNAFRKAEGKTVVKLDDALTKAARYFADYMAKTDRYGHTADDKQPADRVKMHGYEYCIVLENIAYSYNSAGLATAELADGFVNGWKKSPGHRRNMLDADVIETGVAIARSENTGYYYAVQVFGRPKSKMIEFGLSNRSDVTITYKVDDEPYSLEPRYSRTHQRCRAPTLTVQLPAAVKGAPDESKTLRPANGERFVINQESGRLQVKKESSR